VLLQTKIIFFSFTSVLFSAFLVTLASGSRQLFTIFVLGLQLTMQQVNKIAINDGFIYLCLVKIGTNESGIN